MPLPARVDGTAVSIRSIFFRNSRMPWINLLFPFPRCTEDLDECAESEPCLNGGSCTQTEIPGNYTCACPEEYKVNFMNLDL